MIIWLSSYPKNGNTWLRALISAYYYSDDGLFLGDRNLQNIQQFPVKKSLEGFDFDLSKPGDSAKCWIPAQERMNIDKKIKFLKTHSYQKIYLTLVFLELQYHNQFLQKHNKKNLFANEENFQGYNFDLFY